MNQMANQRASKVPPKHLEVILVMWQVADIINRRCRGQFSVTFCPSAHNLSKHSRIAAQTHFLPVFTLTLGIVDWLHTGWTYTKHPIGGIPWYSFFKTLSSGIKPIDFDAKQYNNPPIKICLAFEGNPALTIACTRTAKGSQSAIVRSIKS